MQSMIKYQLNIYSSFQFPTPILLPSMLIEANEKLYMHHSWHPLRIMRFLEQKYPLIKKPKYP